MNARQLSFPVPGNRPAVLSLPQSITPESLLALERSLAAALGALQRETCGGTTDAGQIEYASWLRQLGDARP